MGASVDVVVPVHSTARPIGRAVASALDGAAPGEVRVVVVCHGVRSDAIGALIDPAHLPHCALVPFTDGVPSAAGPKNAGLAAATAPYVALLDSDDHYEPGALSAWLQHATRRSSDVLFPPVVTEHGVLVRSPRVRPRRTAGLDLVRDRLAYQTAHRGLVRRSLLKDAEIRMTPGLPVGEDLAFSTKLYAVAGRLDRAVDVPAYVLTTGRPDQVTGELRPVRTELAAAAGLLQEPWLHALPSASRRAIAVKVVRVHVLDAVLRRPRVEDWAAGDVAWLRDLLAGYRALAPGVLRPFSRADRALLDAVTTAATVDDLAAAARHRLAVRGADWVLTPRLRDNADRESTLRYLSANQAWEAR